MVESRQPQEPSDFFHGTDEGLTIFFTNIKRQNKPFQHAKIENFPLSGYLVCDVDYRVWTQQQRILLHCV